jgi:hypothetical protein
VTSPASSSPGTSSARRRGRSGRARPRPRELEAHPGAKLTRRIRPHRPLHRPGFRPSLDPAAARPSRRLTVTSP